MSDTAYTTDTHAEAEEVQLELLRRMSPQQRIEKMLRLSADVKAMSMSAIRRRRPEFNECQVRIKFIEITYGEDLARGVCSAMGESWID